MNLLRRLALIVYGLALLALVTVILMFPRDVARAIESISRFSSLERGIATFVVAVLILLALFLLVRQPRPYSKDGLMVRASGAVTDVSVQSARERILRAIRAVPNVVDADAKLQSVNGKADIEMDVGVAGSNVNVPEKQREIDRALRQVMLKQLGLQLATAPRVHIQLLSEKDIDARHEDVARPFVPPLTVPSSQQETRQFREEPVAVQYTPPVDAPEPTLSELAQEPAEAETWARMTAVSPDSTAETEPAAVEAVDEALAEDVEQEEIIPEPGPVEAVEPMTTEEETAPPVIFAGPAEVSDEESEEERVKPAGPLEPQLSDTDADYMEPVNGDSSERPSSGLYEDEGDLRKPDESRRPPSVSDLD